MSSLLKLLRETADNIAAAMLAAMFLTFLIQIISRYFLSVSLGWTVELCLTLWLWLVFWVSAFCARDSDHIRFDMLYLAVGTKTRRVFAIVAALGVVVGFLYSLLPTLDYIWFYKIKKSPVMRIPLHYVFSIYGIFIVAIVARYCYRLWVLIYSGSAEHHEGQESL